MRQIKLINMQDDELELFAARLAVIGSTLSSLGDALATLSAIIQLMLISNEKDIELDNNDQPVDPLQIEKMQQEIDILKKELLLFKGKEYPKS